MSLKILKVAIALILFASFALTLTSCGEKIDNSNCIYDRANIISDADKAKIKAAAENANNAEFLIVTHDASDGTTLYGDTVLSQLGKETDENTVIFVITLSRSVYYCNMYTYGVAERRISDSEVEDILLYNDEVISQIKSGRLGDAMVSCIEGSDRAIELPWIIIIVIAVIIGFAAGGITCGVTIAKYKMKMQPTNYPLDKYAKMELTDEDDVFINSRVTVQRISNGSEGRSGGRSGGGSFGGGSGHRGGV